MSFFLLAFYGCFAFVALINLLLMRRPRPQRTNQVDLPTVCILIPARDEERNLERLLPALLTKTDENPTPPKVYVFDDESSDRTAEVVIQCGGILVRPRETLPKGWTGKNRACHELAKAAIEDSDADWMVYLDADVYPSPQFVLGVRDLAHQVPRSVGVISGFPTIIPGRGIEPLFLAWVGWILLSTNPYGLVSKTGIGHNRFTNGQFHCWRPSIYTQLWPNEKVRGSVLEDVMIGRLCAKNKVPVVVANVSSILAVKMYDTWQETLDGMSKNSFEITGTVPGSILVAALLLFIGWGWLLAGEWWPLEAGLFLLSGLFCVMIARAKPYGLFLLPIALTIGAFTVLRSVVWRRRGTVRWKGRIYP